jgi:hypothetical protein
VPAWLFEANLDRVSRPCPRGRVRQPGWVLPGGLGAGMRVVRMPPILPSNSVFPFPVAQGDIYAGPWGSPSTAAVADPANTTLDQGTRGALPFNSRLRLIAELHRFPFRGLECFFRLKGADPLCP